MTTTRENPLSDQERLALAQAMKRLEQLKAPISLAGFNAWSFVILACLTAPFAILMLSPVTIIACACLAIVAINEFRGRAQFRRFDPNAGRNLVINQFLIISLVLVYCLWSMYVLLTGPNPAAKIIANNPEISDMIGPIANMARTMSVIVYIAVIGVTVLYHGSCARHYHQRGKVLKQHLAQTPDWVKQTLAQSL